MSRRSVVPRLEQLEGRECPAVITWIGVSDFEGWSDGLNWDLSRAPTAADDIVFNSDANYDSRMDITFAAPVQSLDIKSGYTGKIEFSNNVTFTVLTLESATATLGGQATVSVDSIFTWTAGTIGDGPVGTLRLLAGSLASIGNPALAGLPAPPQFAGKISGWTVENLGTVAWVNPGTLNLANNAIFQNENTFGIAGLFPVLGGDFTIASTDDTGTFKNWGTFTDSNTAGSVKLTSNIESIVGQWTFDGDGYFAGNANFVSSHITVGQTLRMGSVGYAQLCFCRHNL